MLVDKPKEWWVKRAREEGEALALAGVPDSAIEVQREIQLARLCEYLHTQYMERRTVGDDSAHFFDEWEIALVTLRSALDEAQRERGAARSCLAFFASVIKSGESWSATCQQEYDKARASYSPAEDTDASR